MTLVAAHMSISLDGFGTGANQSLEKPFGEGEAENMHRWMFEDEENNKAERDAVVSYGAYIMGRNMFTAGRGEWDLDWKGWWGPNPPYHAPVFVLTHYARAPIEMEGGTVFHFVTEGPETALERAKAATNNGRVGIAGGVKTLRQYLNAGAVDELHLQVAPVLVHRGERLWDGLTARLEPTGARYTRFATHLDFKVRTTG
ncbi:5-amino-6-(5-phosphoribosylamino)uracil reductase [Devosia geojensis]|uniref:5-amino-6-(5-phosphoribosylamino)uracil reductase n=1 Tax=Devosia geojensis TaxID=443610 RepID=A0A0F5FP75_9HYPH|nr:dihydrofolate reductase family protein [Devosia geojensis]KKB10684.1 5-amino-6-(5-phosphoribosylamino)uracil reductase [Devosia geojensis]